MKKLILILIALLFINSMGICQSFPFLNNSLFKSLNFQCAGFVTAVYPAGISTLESQVLYAKTDIGGVYKSTNNGTNWISISSYYETGEHLFYSEYIIAGLAVNSMNSENVVIAWGSLKTDAVTAEHRCLWMTSNGGSTWHKSSFNDPPSNKGPWFEGDNFMRKVGGECITFDPITPNRVFVGGNPLDGSDSKLFVSNNGGIDFNVLHSFPSDDSILCISIHKTTGRMWIGTTRSVYYSDRVSNYTIFYDVTPQYPYDNYQDFIRILPRRNGDAFIAFGSYTYTTTAKGGLLKYKQSTSTCENYSWNFDIDLGYQDDDKNYLSMLTFADVAPNSNVDENVLIAGLILYKQKSFL